MLLNTESDNECLVTSQKIYSVTISEKPMGADFPVTILWYKTNSLFDMVSKVSCISHSSYKKFSVEPKIDTTVKARDSSTDGSNLGPMGIAVCSITQGPHEFDHKFIV